MAFTLYDVHDWEQKYGKPYFITNGGRQLTPATHVGHNRLGYVSTDPGRGELINWRVVDQNGETVLWGCERNHRLTWAGFVQAVRRALRAIYACGCTQRAHFNGHAR